MSRIKFLLIWMLLLGLVVGLSYTSEAAKKPMTYPELMSKKPKIKEMVSKLLQEKDEWKKRKAAIKLADLLTRVDTILVDYNAIKSIGEVELELLKSENRPLFNVDSVFNIDSLARYQPFKLSKDRDSRYLLVYVEYWRVVDEKFDGQVAFNLSYGSLGVGLNAFLIDRQSQSLLYHVGVFAKDEPVTADEDAIFVWYRATQLALEGMKRYLNYLIKCTGTQ